MPASEQSVRRSCLVFNLYDSCLCCAVHLSPAMEPTGTNLTYHYTPVKKHMDGREKKGLLPLQGYHCSLVKGDQNLCDSYIQRLITHISPATPAASTSGQNIVWGPDRPGWETVTQLESDTCYLLVLPATEAGRHDYQLLVDQPLCAACNHEGNSPTANWWALGFQPKDRVGRLPLDSQLCPGKQVVQLTLVFRCERLRWHPAAQAACKGNDAIRYSCLQRLQLGRHGEFDTSRLKCQVIH